MTRRRTARDGAVAYRRGISRRPAAPARSKPSIAVTLLAASAVLLAACASHPAAEHHTEPHPTTSAPDSSSTSSTSSTTTTTTPPVSVTISAVGDTMLGNTPYLPPDPATYLDPVKSELVGGAQIVFGNLEGTLTTATASKCGSGGPSSECFAFKDPPDYGQYYRDAGFTILNDANNHSYDFGPAGQAQTVESIHAAGMAQTGLPGEITLVHANGVPEAFLAFAPYTYDANLLDLPAAQALIRQARTEAKIVVVYMHVGAEGSDADHVTGQEEYFLGEDRGNPEAFAHMAIDAGASLVIASGPHVDRGMQFYKGHLIVYSMGDFACYGDFSTAGDLGMSFIVHVTLSSTGAFQRAQMYPIQFVDAGQPVPGGGAVPFVAQLSQEDFGDTAAKISPDGVISAP